MASLRRKYDRGTLTYSEYAELLEAEGETEAFARQSYAGYLTRMRPSKDGCTTLYH